MLKLKTSPSGLRVVAAPGFRFPVDREINTVDLVEAVRRAYFADVDFGSHLPDGPTYGPFAELLLALISTNEDLFPEVTPQRATEVFGHPGDAFSVWTADSRLSNAASRCLESLFFHSVWGRLRPSPLRVQSGTGDGDGHGQ